MKVLKVIIFLATLSAYGFLFAGGGHDHKEKPLVKETKTQKVPHNKEEHADIGTVEIDGVGQKEAGIKVTVLSKQVMRQYINAPGEVIPNENQSSKVTPRIAAQILSRKVNVGDKVKKGQPLATLSSVEVAKAQSDLLLSHDEWQRVEILGKQAVGAKRYQTAKINYKHAFARLIAYGITRAQAENFLKSKKSAVPSGEFTLLSPQKGIVYDAQIIEGQRVEPGHVLYHILDESFLWVDARLSNGNVHKIKKGAVALISTSQGWVEGQVTQIHHKLEENTRTQIVRLTIPNKDDVFHPGQFVNCRIATADVTPVLAVPEAAVLRTTDGDWAIYVETKPNHFKQIEITLIETQDNYAIIEGVDPGVRVVTENAFAVHSELLKAGFKTHNH